MTTQPLPSTILKHIEERHLTPRPQWQFVLHEVVMWAIGLVAVLIGAVAVAVMTQIIVGSDFDLLLRGGGNPVADALRLFPYFWLVLLALFVALARYQLQHTKRGYRYPVLGVLAALVGTSVLLGAIFSLTGVGRMIDHAFERSVSVYGDLLSPRHGVWCPSDGGRLGGLVVDVMDADHFCVIDIEGNAWIVNVSESRENSTQIKPHAVVRMLGESSDPGFFQATTIRVKSEGTPFGPPDRFTVDVQRSRCATLYPRNQKVPPRGRD